MADNILITGGFGNLGSWLTKYFLEKGNNVFVTTNSDRNILEIFKNVRIIKLDLAFPNDFNEELSNINFDVIIHGASYNEYSNKDFFWKSYRINSEGTSSLLNKIKLNNLRHFIYLSTYHVYGKNSGIIEESNPTLPLNDYANSHLSAENIIRQHAIVKKLPATILRLTNSYGAPIDPRTTKWDLLLNDLARMAFFENKLFLKSAPETYRDFVWMGDVSEIIYKLTISEPKKQGQLLNLSYGKSLSILEAAETIKKAYKIFKGIDIPLEYHKDNEISKKETFFQVKSELIKNIVQVKPKNKILEEAIKTFKVLENLEKIS